MMKILLAIVLAFFLVACNSGSISLVVNTPVVSPSPLPLILSPTPRFIPSATSMTTSITPSPIFTTSASFTPTEILTPSPTFTFTPTSTATFTATTSPTIATSATAILVSNLSLDIIGCNTSLDILHQMGEVTNAYPIIRNFTRNNLTNVCATLSATDEARVHPDKTACVIKLPAGYQVTLKLTVDTGLGQDTAIQVDVNTGEDLQTSVSRSSCKDIGLPGWVPEKVGVIEPIQ